MPEVSFIVPMFKAKPYIGPCVASLLRQEIEDFEILLIDDCSPDDTCEYAEALFRDDSRVRVIRQEQNGGPGQARNRGIEEAAGEYICFADADDIYADGAVRQMLDVTLAYDADVYYANEMYFTVAETLPDDLARLTKDQLVCLGHVTEEEVSDQGKIRLAGDMHERVTDWMKHRYHWSSCGKLFRRSFLREHNIRYPNFKLGEDQVFILSALVHAPVYLTHNSCPYVCRFGSNVSSVSRGSRSVRVFVDGLKSLFGAIEWLDKMLERIEYFKQHPEERRALINYHAAITEKEFTLSKYQEIGRETLSGCEEVHRVFNDYFGKKGAFVEKTLFDAYDGKAVAIKEEFKTDGTETYHTLKKIKDYVGDGVFNLLGRIQ